MNRTTLVINGESIDLQFGIWTMARLSDFGFKLKEISEVIKDNPFDFIPTLIYLGACGAAGRDLAAYDKNLFWDHIDAVGFGHDDVTKAMTCFTNSLSQDVPQKKSQPKVSGKK